jgi:hypothetical protein
MRVSSAARPKPAHALQGSVAAGCKGCTVCNTWHCRRARQNGTAVLPAGPVRHMRGPPRHACHELWRAHRRGHAVLQQAAVRAAAPEHAGQQLLLRPHPAAPARRQCSHPTRCARLDIVEPACSTRALQQQESTGAAAVGGWQARTEGATERKG